MIFIEDLGDDRDTAAIVLSEARRLAPCLDDLVGDDFDTARAILARAAKRSAEIASTLKRKTAGDWSFERFGPDEIGDAFVASDRATLQALCGVSSSSQTGPLGCFPPARPPFRP